MEKITNILALVGVVLVFLFILVDYGFYKKNNQGPTTQQEIAEVVHDKEMTIAEYNKEKIKLMIEIERVEADIDETRTEISALREEEDEEKANGLETRLNVLLTLREDIDTQIKLLKGLTRSVEGDLEPLLTKLDN